MLPAQDFATLSGSVADPQGIPVPDASVTLTAIRDGVTRQAVTDAAGMFVIDSLAPGDYRLAVSKPGYSRLAFESLHTGIRDRRIFNLELTPERTAASVVVKLAASGVSADISSGAATDGEYARNLPLGARDVASLVSLAPGAVTTFPQAPFNVNGQRATANYYTLDGLSAAEEHPPLETIEEARVQTAALAPEFGRAPGAQVAVSSRTGGSALHGALYGYLANDRTSANDWFANQQGLSRAKTRGSNFGGLFGGPLRKNRTFLLASYDVWRLTQPETTLMSVPDMETRQAAPASLRPFLNAFPQPNGPALDNGTARFSATVPQTYHRTFAGLRLDHTLGSGMNVFLRYSHTPSVAESRGTGALAPNVIRTSDFKTHSATLGFAGAIDPETFNDFRLNVSTTSVASRNVMDAFGGAAPLPDYAVFPPEINNTYGAFRLRVLGLGAYAFGEALSNRYRQQHIADAISRTVGAHQWRFGADLRRSTPTYHPKAYDQTVTFRSLSGEKDALLSGTAVAAVVASHTPSVYPSLVNFSFYGQDTFRASERTTLLVGLRWEVNPALGTRSGPRPLAFSDSTVCGVTASQAMYRTAWLDLAPRLGVAHQIDTTPGREMIFRFGAGIFYDSSYGLSADPFAGAPYSNVRSLTEPAFPLAAADSYYPPLPAERPFGLVSTAESALRAPLIYQWSATLERMFGPHQSLSLGYIGSKGERLIRIENDRSFDDTGVYDILRYAANDANSNFNGIQLQWRHSMARRLQFQLSYMASHSIDTASRDLAFDAGFASLYGEDDERHDSDFDVRQSLNLSASVGLPAPNVPVLRNILGGWWTDWVVTARSALPFTVYGVSTLSSDGEEDLDSDDLQGLYARVRPNYLGSALWLFDRNTPGGRRLNQEAFELTDDYSQGSLPRNAIRGLGISQVNLSLRREIVIGERWRFHVMAQAFNLLNHPNFANPSADGTANLSSPDFGAITGTLSQPGTGGPRSLRWGLRLQF